MIRRLADVSGNLVLEEDDRNKPKGPCACGETSFETMQVEGELRPVDYTCVKCGISRWVESESRFIVETHCPGLTARPATMPMSKEDALGRLQEIRNLPNPYGATYEIKPL